MNPVRYLSIPSRLRTRIGGEKERESGCANADVESSHALIEAEFYPDFCRERTSAGLGTS